MRIGQGRARRMKRKIRRQFARRGNVALADAGPLHDPFIGGLNRTRKLVITDNARREIASTTKYDRTQRRHELAPLARRADVPACRSRAIA